jgi:hypothetical protein
VQRARCEARRELLDHDAESARQKKETAAAACVFVAARVSQLARPPKKPLCVKRLFII